MSVRQAAEKIGLSEARLYMLIGKKEFPAVRIGNVYRVPVGAFEQWLADKSAEALASVRTSAANEGEKGGAL
jgi:excisionase family DNA binding protein